MLRVAGRGEVVLPSDSTTFPDYATITISSAPMFPRPCPLLSTWAQPFPAVATFDTWGWARCR
eukprot:819801-Prymnesium_polylepis.1